MTGRVNRSHVAPAANASERRSLQGIENLKPANLPSQTENLAPAAQESAWPDTPAGSASSTDTADAPLESGRN